MILPTITILASVDQFTAWLQRLVQDHFPMLTLSDVQVYGSVQRYELRRYDQVVVELEVVPIVHAPIPSIIKVDVLDGVAGVRWAVTFPFIEELTVRLARLRGLDPQNPLINPRAPAIGFETGPVRHADGHFCREFYRRAAEQFGIDLDSPRPGYPFGVITQVEADCEWQVRLEIDEEEIPVSAPFARIQYLTCLQQGLPPISENSPAQITTIRLVNESTQAIASTSPNADTVQIRPDRETVGLRPVRDAIDHRILELVTADPDLTDFEIGQKLNLSRTAINNRRRRLEEMGYKVR